MSVEFKCLMQQKGEERMNENYFYENRLKFVNFEITNDDKPTISYQPKAMNALFHERCH